MHNLRSNMRLALPPSFLQPFTNCSKKKKTNQKLHVCITLYLNQMSGINHVFLFNSWQSFSEACSGAERSNPEEGFHACCSTAGYECCCFFLFFSFSLRTYFTKNCWLYPKSCCRGNCSVRWPFWFQKSLLCGNPSPINPAISWETFRHCAEWIETLGRSFGTALAARSILFWFLYSACCVVSHLNVLRKSVRARREKES